MSEIAQRHIKQLERIKKTVRTSHDAFRPNYDRYNEFRRFVFESSLNADEMALLMQLGRPTLEFNVLEAYISRLLGEFSKQEPDIEVSADDESKADPNMIRLIEAHLRHALLDQKNEHTRYEVYKDLLSGGFSTLKVTTDYANPMSMDQVINIERAYDPTLCGFDQLAKYSHKGDGRFCFELFPKCEDDFKEEYPGIKLTELSFRRDFAGFNWSYLNDTTKVVMVADYYEKKKKEKTIVQLQDGKVITMNKYNKMVEEWNDITMPPAILGKPRKTIIETICRYRLIENKILEYVETDFSHLPLIFVDGHSVLVKTPKNGNIRQVTRPYVYHAKGAQKLKNYAGIAIANEIENSVQHKFMVAKEALPKEEEFLEAYKNVQRASTLVFNSVHEENPDMPINNPIREIVRAPSPPEFSQAFTGADSLIQNVLGSYDASLGINNNQLSGIAVVESATQSNAAAMPYIVGFLQGMQRAAQVYVDLMPKYFTTPRTLPVIDDEGKRHAIPINQENGVHIEYDANQLNVVLKAGASFQVQKARTINMLKEVMQLSPITAQFIGEKGIPFILDNMEGKGIEQLKELTSQWTQEYEQQKQQAQQAQQAQQMQDPAMMKIKIEMEKLQHEKEKDEAQFVIDMMKIKFEEKKLKADMHMEEQRASVQLVKARTEQRVHELDADVKRHDQAHNHLKEAIHLGHIMEKENKKEHRTNDRD